MHTNKIIRVQKFQNSKKTTFYSDSIKISFRQHAANIHINVLFELQKYSS